MRDDPTDIFNWRRFDERLTTSGQPTEDQLAVLGAHGVTEIVNLALHSHEKALADEAGSVAALAMRYTHIPVQFENPTEADFARFCAAMDARDGAVVHVHCIANFRVSAFLYRYHRERRGVAERDAKALMDSVWRPGGVWARLIGDEGAVGLPHRYAGRDY
jgi:protein tyrosine phosphatase (PTP) superfamily phosphohydrolase (DUF442 family)